MRQDEAIIIFRVPLNVNLYECLSLSVSIRRNAGPESSNHRLCENLHATIRFMMANRTTPNQESISEPQIPVFQLYANFLTCTHDHNEPFVCNHPNFRINKFPFLRMFSYIMYIHLDMISLYRFIPISLFFRMHFIWGVRHSVRSSYSKRVYDSTQKLIRQRRRNLVNCQS